MSETAERLQTGQYDLPPNLLHESPQNPRTIKSERFEALKASLKLDPEMLKARPIIATPDGDVVAGNMRLRAAKDIGMEDVPVYVIELDPQRKREWMMRDNNEYGEWVPDQLAELIKAYTDQGGDTLMLGFEPDDVTKLLESLDAAPVIPDATEQEDPTLGAEVVVEIYTSKELLAELSPTLEEWSGLDGVEVNISG